jgi:hypothetical protein
MTDMATRSFVRGAAAAKAAVKQAPSTDRPGYFKLADGETAFVRFLIDFDEWPTADRHNFIPTKPKPADWEGNWPESVSPVCRNSKMGDGLPLYGDCYVEASGMKKKNGKPHRPQARTWAIGVLREEVLGDGTEQMGGPSKFGKRLGFRDKTKEVDELKKNAAGDYEPSGKKIKVKDIVIFTMGWQNFFNALEGAANIFGTVLDRDFAITRSGAELDTTYQITGLDATPGHDLRDPETAAKYGITIAPDGTRQYPDNIDCQKLIAAQASDEFYARYVDPTKTIDGASAPPEKQSNDATAEKLAEMVSRIKGYPITEDESPVNFDI